jgi:hypothetical protein
VHFRISFIISLYKSIFQKNSGKNLENVENLSGSGKISKSSQKLFSGFMRLFKILKNFLQLSEEPSGSGKDREDCTRSSTIHLRTHKNSCVGGVCTSTGFSLSIEKISRKFLEIFWKILENCENFPVLFHIFLMYLKFSKPQTQDLVC